MSCLSSNSNEHEYLFVLSFATYPSCSASLVNKSHRSNKVIAPLTLTIGTTNNTCTKEFTVLFQTRRLSAFTSSSMCLGGEYGRPEVAVFKARGFFDFKLATLLLRIASKSGVF
jgi:hypothetical protein